MTNNPPTIFPESDGWLPEMVERFFAFCVERQNIWERRWVQNLPPPWTSDPDLQSNKAENIYRELDYGTQYCIQKILPYESFPDVLFNVYRYRLFNLPTTFRATGGFLPIGSYDAAEATAILTERQQADYRVFSPAWQVAAKVGAGSKGRSKIADYCDAIAAEQSKMVGIAYVLEQTDHMGQAHEILKQLRWCGGSGWVAYQLALDLGYLPRFKHWQKVDWVHPGPGAIKGVNLLHRPCDHVRVIQYLARHQAVYLDPMGFKYLQRTDDGPVRLDSHAIEFALCGWQKIERIKRGQKHGKKFTPRPKLFTVKLTVPS